MAPYRVQVGRVLEVADGHEMGSLGKWRQVLRLCGWHEEGRQRQLARRHAVLVTQQLKLGW